MREGVVFGTQAFVWNVTKFVKKVKRRWTWSFKQLNQQREFHLS